MIKKGIQSKLEELDKEGTKIEFVKYQYADLTGDVRELTVARESVHDGGYEGTDGSSAFSQIIKPTESQLLLGADLNTLTRVYGSDHVARVICNVYHPFKKGQKKPRHFNGCSRGLLEKMEKGLTNALKDKVEKMFPGKKVKRVDAHFAPELEFLMLDGDYDLSKLHTDPSFRNNQYFVPPKTEVAEMVMQDMLRAFAQIGLLKEKYHTEVTGVVKRKTNNGQYEVNIGHANVLTIADAVFAGRYIMKKVGQKHGVIISFIPKFKTGVNGSGMHVHQNLAVHFEGEDKPTNLFYDEKQPGCLSKMGQSYIEGKLVHAREITALTNPLPISFKRLVPDCEAPTYIGWDWANRTVLCRGHEKDEKKVRCEYRAPDPSANPYHAFAAMLSAGLEGIEQNLKLRPAEANRNFYHDNKDAIQLPGNLEEALDEMNNSKMLRKRMGNFMIDTVYDIGKKLWVDYSQEVTDADIRRFF